MEMGNESGFYAVGLYFDRETEEAIIRLQRDIAGTLQAPLPPGRPHLTLGAGRDRRVREEEAAFRAIGESVAGEAILFSSIGAFPGEPCVLFLAPIVTDALLALHRRADEVLQEASPALAQLYRPGRWVPHCTVADRLTNGQLLEAIAIAAAFPMPLTATLSGVEVHWYPAPA